MDRNRLRDAARSVRVRILVSILIVTALGMAVAGAVTIVVQRERVLSQIDGRLAATADTIRQVAKSGDGNGNVPTDVRSLLTTVMARVIPDHNESTIAVIDGAAALVPAADVSFHLDKDSAFVDQVIAEADPSRVIVGTTDARAGTLRYVIVPVAVNGDARTGLYVSAYNLSSELSELRDSFTTYAVVAAGALVVIGLVGWFVSGRLLRPIRSLRETAARISVSDLHERIPVDGNDDVSDLARTVNGMLDRLEGSFLSQRRLLDDVSHELKTPLTIVRGHLELMDADAPNEVRVTRDIAINELDRMDTLVVDIGLLVKSGNPGFIRPATTDIAELTEMVHQKAAMLSGAHAWLLGEVAEADADIDAAKVTQAWLQLADNAAKYTPTFTAIDIGSTIVDDGRSIDLWVADEGEGIPEEAQERVFERFARAQEGRGIEGSGLGLSIVAAIAEAHGGRVVLDSTVGVGSRFAIRLPLPQPRSAHVAHPTPAAQTPSAQTPSRDEELAETHPLSFDDLIGLDDVSGRKA